jgi:hypothetical protein
MYWIIKFSELEDFIDQPFKTYSTGMQARLTFSTAVCIDPDVLIIDEALSVGDARFQRKSFGKIDEFRKSGHTILLVSHDINTINSFCNQAILLEKGHILAQGDPQFISKVYYKLLFAPNEKDDENVSSEIITENENVSLTKEIILNPMNIKHENGYAWQVDLSEFNLQGDSIEFPQNSLFRLFENDRKLAPPHWLHDYIRQYGKGAYSHWGKQLLFSTSDNSNPCENNRKYAFKQPNVEEIESIYFPSKNRLDTEREAIRRYALEQMALKEPFTQGNPRQMRMGNGNAEIIDFGILDSDGNRAVQLLSSRKYTFYFCAVFYADVVAASATFLIRDIKGVDMYGISLHGLGLPCPPRKKGDIMRVDLQVTMWLTNGTYFLTFNSRDPKADSDAHHDAIFDAYQFEVERKPGIFHASVVDLDASIGVKIL